MDNFKLPFIMNSVMVIRRSWTYVLELDVTVICTETAGAFPVGSAV